MKISKIIFYLFLLQKKFKTGLRILFEKKVGNSDFKTAEDLKFFLLQYILNKLIKTARGIYFNTKIKNKGRPMTLAQARVLLSFCKLYDKNQINFNDKYIIENLKEFILSLKDESGIYKFNQKRWNLQDEGIATIWTLLALLQVYKISNDPNLLNEIVNTVNVMHKKLVDENNSLLHNFRDNH